MTDTTARVAPVRHSVTVPLRIEDAWRLFTEGMGGWWPLPSHSLAGDAATGIEVDGREGGEVRELTADGQSRHWATILVWQPPTRLVLAWELHSGTNAATEVEVVFIAAVGGGTRVDLEHRNWERLGERAVELRENYRTGWPFVIGRYEGAAGPPSPVRR